MGENVRIATSEDGSGIDMANERQEEEGGAQRGHRRFLRRPKTQCVTEEKLPRRARDALVSESAVDEAVEMDNMQGKHRAKLILGVVVVAVVISAIVDLSCHENIRSWLQESFDWIESNPKAGENTQRNEQRSITRPQQVSFGVDCARCSRCIAEISSGATRAEGSESIHDTPSF